MGQAAIPVYLALAATAVQTYNTKKTADKQDAITAEGIRRQGEQQRKATARLNQTLDLFEKSNASDERVSLADRFANQIRIKRALGLEGLDTPGATSDAYEKKSDETKTRVLSRAGTLADLFSRIDAPKDQRIKERNERGDLGSDLSVYGRNSAAENYMTRLRLNGVQRDPYLDFLAAGLSGASSGLASGSSAPLTIFGARTPGARKPPSAQGIFTQG